MTNSGIKTGRILDALYEAKAEVWREQRKTDSKTGEYVRFEYSEFKKILRKNEIATDPRTIKLKWELLTDIGIFAASNKISAIVDLLIFENYNPKYELVINAPCTHTLTHTHLSDAEEAGE